jgi:hypothetical protein
MVMGLLFCNESLFSPPPKAFFLKLSSAWREEIVIGASLAILNLDAGPSMLSRFLNYNGSAR